MDYSAFERGYERRISIGHVRGHAVLGHVTSRLSQIPLTEVKFFSFRINDLWNEGRKYIPYIASSVRSFSQN